MCAISLCHSQPSGRPASYRQPLYTRNRQPIDGGSEVHSITRRTADRPPGTISTAPSAGRGSQVLHDSPLEGSGFEPSVPVRSGSFRPPLLGAVKVPIPPQGPPLTNRNRTAAAIGLPRSPPLATLDEARPRGFQSATVCKSVRSVGKRRPNIASG